MRNAVCCLVALVMLTPLWSCTVPYGIYADKRLVDTMTADKNISIAIKNALMEQDFTGGWEVKTYCYYGKVFLVGEVVPKHLQDKAVAIARKTSGVRTVSTHWFTPASGGENNLVLATKLRTNLLSADGLSSTRVDTEVNAGRVVLLGVVANEQEKQAAIKAAKETGGVRHVTSLLMFPQ